MGNNQEKPKTAKAKAQSEKEVLDVQIVEAKDITVEDVISTEIKKFNLADAKISELKAMFKDIEINGVEDKENYQKAKDALKILQKHRTGVDKKHTELKAFYLQTGRAIDGEKKQT